MAKKLAYLVKYLRIYWTDFYNLFTIWKRFECRWYTCTFLFQFVEGSCYGNQLFLGQYHKRRLIPLAFFALLSKNELQYHYLNMRANSGDDVAISCKNLVNFCLVTPEIMELIWERQVRHVQKTGVFRGISPAIWVFLSRIGYFLAMASVSVDSDTEEITSSENGGQNSHRYEWEEISSLITQVPVGRFVPYLPGKWISWIFIISPNMKLIG